MSHNQSRSDKSETTQYRRTGRYTSSCQQRGVSGHSGSGKGGGGGGSSGATVPTPITSSASSLAPNRSFKKNNIHNNAQAKTSGSGLIQQTGNASAPPHTAQNGAHGQHPPHGPFDARVASAADWSSDSSSQKGTRSDPRMPSSTNAAASTSDKTRPSTPAKGEGSKGFPFQFGTLSPGLMNGMQIPARTSSAPPNLDEQKRDQARHDAYRATPPAPIPSAPKQQFPRKDAAAIDESIPGEARPLSKGKRDMPVSSMPAGTQSPKPSVHSMSGMAMQVPFHQQQASLQFGAPKPQIPPQSMPGPTAIPLPMGSSPQVQQQMFVPALQHHSLQPQGIMPQGQSLSFSTPMGHQLPPPQLGNMGINITSQYPQQQTGKFNGARKPVKITDPKTHEELRFDKKSETYIDGGSAGLRPHSNTPQSQPIPSFSPGQPISYYTNSYNAGIYFSTSSVPITSTQVNPSSQAPKLNYPVGQSVQSVPYMNPSTLSSLPANKSGNSTHAISEPLNFSPAVASSVPLPTVQVTVKSVAGSSGEKVGHPSVPVCTPVQKHNSLNLPKSCGGDNLNNSLKDAEIKAESSQQQLKSGHEPRGSTSLPVSTKQTAPTVSVSSISVENPSSSTISSSPKLSAVSKESPTLMSNAEVVRNESLSRSNSIKDHQKKVAKKGNTQTQDQVGELSFSVSSFPSQSSEHADSVKGGLSESLDFRSTTTSAESGEVLEFTEPMTKNAVTPETGTDNSRSDHKSSELTTALNNVEAVQTVHYARHDGLAPEDENHRYEIVETIVKNEDELLESRGGSDSEFSSESISLKSLDVRKDNREDSVANMTSEISSVVCSLKPVQVEMERPVEFQKDDWLDNSLLISSSRAAVIMEAPTLVSTADKALTSDASLTRSNSTSGKAVAATKSSISDLNSATVMTASSSQATLKHEAENAESTINTEVPLPVSGSKDKPVPELSRSKSSTARGRKKKKEILQKADAQGTTSDLYIAYKGPGENKENMISLGSKESGSSNKQLPANVAQEDVLGSEGGVQAKAEPDDWEDAADISTPKLEASNNREHDRQVNDNDEGGHDNLAKKYSRDFLLKFADQCAALPDDFNVKPDIEAILVANANNSHLADHELYPASGRIIDRSSGGSRLDRRGSGMIDEDKWSKPHGPFASGRNSRLDMNYGGNVVNFAPGQGGNYGVLRNPRAQAPIQYIGGILSGPVQSLGPQGGMQRNSPDADRWQRATSFQKGLIPSPLTPLQVMHKAEKKYEVGKVTDEEQAKQRQLKAILNKLTPQNFEKLFEQVKAVNIDKPVTLTGIISQIFDKALMEPTFCEMYANFCSHLAVEMPDFSEDNEKITFKRLLLNKCQEEFERGEREQEEANRVEEGEIKQTEEEREEKRLKARRRMLGNIRLIGELFKKRMLTERIMHECIKKLLGQYLTPDEEDIEALCKLMSTIGEMIDHQKAKALMDSYFERMVDLSNNQTLSSRVRFMLKDSIDLRKNKWQQRRKVEGPKKIEEVHRDAAQERQAQVSRLSRAPGINPSQRRPMDFGSRGATMAPSPSAQLGGYRGLPTQSRGFGNQDVRVEDRHPYEGRPLSVPLSQRSIGDDAITLGPQGGLARGMSSRGQPSISGTPLADPSQSFNDSRRMTSGFNGSSSMSEWTGGNTREDAVLRNMPERLARDQLSVQERNMPFGSREIRNPDRSPDRSLASPLRTQSVSSDRVWPEEQLRKMSIAAIKEFYSARDEKEVALCIKDLNSPSFYPTMISIWVTDSFERKDFERDLLAKLLISLTKSRDAMLSRPQLIKGFEAVLTTLEDAVNDAPRAGEFLGHIFGKAVLENVITLEEVGRLIRDGGEEPGTLRKVGLADEVLGTALEMIKSEKGDSVLNEICASLTLAEFRHPDLGRSTKLQMFI